MKINWQFPPDDIRPGLELGSDANSNFIRVNWALPPDDQFPAFEVLSDGASQAVNIKLGLLPTFFRERQTAKNSIFELST